MKNILSFVTAIYLLSCPLTGFASHPLKVTAANSQGLYPNEQVIKLSGYPALMYFTLGKVNKPLVIFIPGGYNLARIAYGTPTTDPSDYLAHWFHQHGFSFMGLSYPLNNKIYDSVYPAFTITDWAQQIAEAATMQIKAHKLPHTFIMLGWSMAGKTVVQVNQFAQSNGMKMIYISLSSDPPIRGLVKSHLFDKLVQKPTAQGLSSRASLIPWFTDQIHEENKINGHEIIADNTYIDDIMGDQPVNLLGSSTQYKNGKFIKHPAMALADTDALAYDNYPMIGLLHGNYQSDYINALFTQFDWSPMLARTGFNLLMQNMKIAELKTDEWSCLEIIIRNLPRLMSRQIHGNHLFFLGKRGAQQTVTEIESLMTMIDEIKAINTPAKLCEFSKKLP